MTQVHAQERSLGRSARFRWNPLADRVSLRELAREFGRYDPEISGSSIRHRLTFHVDAVRYRISGEPTPHGKRRPFKSEEHARSVLLEIQAEVANGKDPLQAISPYLDRNAPENQIRTWLNRWLEIMRERTDEGERSPTYLRELERYAKEGGHFDFWTGRALWEPSFALLEDWNRWLKRRKLGPKTRRNVLAAFRSFLGWLKRRQAIRSIPDFPEITVDPHTPVLISREMQDRILEQIPWDRRGGFIALARLGRRVSEVRANNVDDYEDGWLLVDKALKGPNSQAPVGSTKNRRIVRLPIREIAPDLVEWIEWRISQVTPRERLQGRPVPMFPNPTARNAEKRWIWNTMREEWKRACDALGVDVPLQEGTKHSRATALLESGADLGAVQGLLGHADQRSTMHYAQLTGRALIQGLKPKK